MTFATRVLSSLTRLVLRKECRFLWQQSVLRSRCQSPGERTVQLPARAEKHWDVCHPQASVRHGLCRLQANHPFYFNLGDGRQEAGPLHASFLLRLMSEASGTQGHQRKFIQAFQAPLESVGPAPTTGSRGLRYRAPQCVWKVLPWRDSLQARLSLLGILGGA